MSAIGYYIANDKIITLSDGGWWRGSQQLRDDFPKVCRLSSRVGLLMVGAGIVITKRMGKRAIRNGFSDPCDIAYHMGESLHLINSVNGTEEVSSYLTLVIGYDSQGDPQFWQLRAVSGEENTYEPQLFELKPGAANAVAADYNASETPFRELLKESLEDGQAPEDAAFQAFSNMVRDFESGGVQIGGKIYMEIYRPG